MKIDVIPSRLEEYMVFILHKNLIFIDSMQFMNSCLEKLVKNLPDDDFKYLTQEFDSNHLKLLKQKDVYPYEYMVSFERFSEEKLPKCFYRSLKDRTTGDNGKKLNGQISDKEYLTCIKIWNEKYGWLPWSLFEKRCFAIRCFEKFISACLRFYILAPCNCFSSLGLSWD